jgi:hypothetical protein
MSAAPDPLTREEDDDDLPAAIDTRPFFIETRSGRSALAGRNTRLTPQSIPFASE